MACNKTVCCGIFLGIFQKNLCHVLIMPNMSCLCWLYMLPSIKLMPFQLFVKLCCVALFFSPLIMQRLLIFLTSTLCNYINIANALQTLLFLLNNFINCKLLVLVLIFNYHKSRLYIFVVCFSLLIATALRLLCILLAAFIKLCQ